MQIKFKSPPVRRVTFELTGNELAKRQILLADVGIQDRSYAIAIANERPRSGNHGLPYGETLLNFGVAAVDETNGHLSRFNAIFAYNLHNRSLASIQNRRQWDDRPAPLPKNDFATAESTHA
jgi:hypothetical protein